jgi:hypothetical protein
MQDNSKEVELSYLAGIMDGEGAIFITRDVYASKNPVYRCETRVGMIDQKPIMRLYNAFGGTWLLEKPYHHKRPMYRWLGSNREVLVYTLNLLMPYLDVKKEQAILALQFIEKFPARRGHWAPTGQIDEKLEYWVKMRELNGLAMPATTERTGKRGRSKSVRLDATV